MRTFNFLLIALALNLSSVAQKQCGTEAYQERIRQEFPLSLIQKGIPVSLSIAGSSTASGPDTRQMITIPVVVHVLYNNESNNLSEAVINRQIEILNRDFNLAGDDASKIPSAFSPRAGVANIRFQLAKVDPDGRATTGIDRKKSSREFWGNDDKIKDPAFGGVKPWDSRSYLNIWVGNLVPGLLGYSSAPGGPAERDGVVIRANVFGGGGGSFSMGRTAVHEVGHWLNLKHLWGDGECGSDGVDDTPQQRRYNQGCPSFPKLNTTCGDGNSAGEMFMNFMDFTDDACMLMFTSGQISRMRETFAAGGLRESIRFSRALGEPWNKGVTATPAAGGTVSAEVSISVYPNPASSNITLSSKGSSLAGTRYTLFTLDGRRIQEGMLSNENASISVASLKPGLYFVKLSGQDHAIRFVRQ
jgi:hypothetical protein